MENAITTIPGKEKAYASPRSFTRWSSACTCQIVCGYSRLWEHPTSRRAHFRRHFAFIPPCGALGPCKRCKTEKRARAANGPKKGARSGRKAVAEESLGDAAVAARGPADLCPNVTLFISKSASKVEISNQVRDFQYRAAIASPRAPGNASETPPCTIASKSRDSVRREAVIFAPDEKKVSCLWLPCVSQLLLHSLYPNPLFK